MPILAGAVLHAATPSGAAPALRLPRRDAAVALGIFAIAVAFFSLTMNRTLDVRDEGYLLNLAVRTAAGEMPHRDFIDIYGPGAHLVNGLVIRAFGPKLLPMRAFIVGVKAVTVVLAFAAARFVASLPLAALAASFAMAWWGRPSWILNTPYASLYSIPICLLALLVLLRGLSRGSLRGIAAAGGVAALGLLFKQSLGLASAYALGLATWAIAMLEEPAGRRPSLETAVALAGWGLAAIAVVLPFLDVIRRPDYVLHFLPLHLFMALIAAAVLRRGHAGGLVRILRPLLALSLGWALVASAIALPYVAWDAFDEIWFDMFVFPPTLLSYYVPVPLGRPLPLVTFLTCAGGSITALLFALRGRWRLALCAAGATLVALALAAWVDTWNLIFLSAPSLLWKVEAVQPAALSLGAIALLAPVFLRPSRPENLRTMRLAAPVLCVHALMSFQIFPRAVQNIFVLQAGLAPLLALVLGRWARIGAAERESWPRGVVAGALVLTLPLWWTFPSVAWLGGGERADEKRRPVNLPGAEGLALGPRMQSWNHLDDLEQVVAHLHSLRPEDAPLLLLTEDELISFLSRRPALFPEKQAYRFWASLGLLPSPQIEALESDEMLARLRNTPEAVIVRSRSPGGRRLASALPKLDRFLREEFMTSGRFGRYTVLTRRPRDGASEP